MSYALLCFFTSIPLIAYSSSQTFAIKLYNVLSKNKYFEKSRFSEQEFGIKHFAGKAMYSTKGFLEKVGLPLLLETTLPGAFIVITFPSLNRAL